MFDAQAWYARDVILGRLTVPNGPTRRADMDTWAQREQALLANGGDDEAMIRYQMDYTADLVNAIANDDYPSWDFELTVQTFLQWEHAKHEDIMGYRNECYRSA
eukprot:CAMPEP_0172468458 /NCGR_PEP_ID=MMETSP1065-20121228/61309_1 /TAXON_ID=265537 /ORGANISM="Amphiprora paludosa, Strain CCMP125" /LENGTH=103 /DNA_ID=CAMNT_0013225849 /DNA_START=195 /DNA_END=503 /DNA_ORIENTATION=-